MAWHNKIQSRSTWLILGTVALTIAMVVFIKRPIQIVIARAHPAFNIAQTFLAEHPQLMAKGASANFDVLELNDRTEDTTPIVTFAYTGNLNNRNGQLSIELRHNPGQDWIVTRIVWMAANETKPLIVDGPNEWLNAANTALAAKNITEARMLCERMIAISPQDFRGEYCNALVTLQEGDHKRANLIMQDLTRTYPLAQVIHILKADLLQKTGQRARSIDSYVDAWNLGAKAELAAVIADYHQDHGDAKNALLWLNRARDAGLLTADIFYGYGRYHYSLGDYPHALTAFEQAAARNTGHTDAWYGVGLSYQKLNLNAQAITAYQRAIQTSPAGAINVRKSLAQTFLAEERYDQALAELQNILNFHPDDIDALAWLTLLYARSGRMEDAQTVYAKLKAKAPDRADKIVQGLNLRTRPTVKQIRQI